MGARQADDPLVGCLLDGRYRLGGGIARGGTATVYRGLDQRLDRPVAVKVVHRSLADDPDFVARLTREARAAARLSAPEVVAVYDQGRDALTGAAYLVLELVEGRDLRALLDERGALPPALALSVLEPVLRALAAAHRAGIVHRDVKPENVLLGADGLVKVADFGLARALTGGTATTTTGLLVGTVAYLAPEQIESGAVDARTDVYATGVLLWEALTGALPYAAQTPMQVAYRHVHDDVPAPSTAVGGIPAALDDLVVRATRRDPGLRPPDAAAFLAEVRALRARLPGGPAPDGHGGRPAPPDLQDRSAPQDRQAPQDRHDPHDPPASLDPQDPPARQDPPAPGPARHDTLVVERPVPPAPPTGLPPAAASRRVARRRRRGPALGLVVLLLALAAAGGGWWLGAARFTEAPGVLALTQPEAEQRLRAAGLGVAVQDPRHDETVPAGQVLDQQPDPGSRVRRDAAVELVLSRGPDRRTVPASAVGATRRAATAAVEAVGLRVGDDPAEEYADAPAGTVLRTDPAPGRRLRPGALVTLVLSRGVEQLPVPDVRGRQRAAAEAGLRSAGLTPAVELVASDTVPTGVVVDQSPTQGTAGRGSTVALAVSRGPELTQVPSLEGLGADEAEAALALAGLRGSAVDVPDGRGRVVTQTPSPGETVPRGSSVTYYVL